MVSRFPTSIYPDAGAFAADYFSHLATAAATVSGAQMARAGEVLAECATQGRHIYTCGNGGSASVANHLVCDCLKGTRTNSTLRPRVTSLSSNVELLTAVMNDISSDEVFSYPLTSLARPGDVLITISSSGNSPNIVRAVETAREVGMTTIAMTGFSGGRSAPLADVNLHVAASNYGVVEDLHQSMMHILAQHLRQAHLEDPERIAEFAF